MTDPHAAFPYSPERRTAVILTGTGADGAYHAGALRALHEAGVKIDLVAGQGMGAVSATLAAIDGAARLWEPGGLWRQPSGLALYGWKWPIRAAAWLLLLLAGVFALPFLVLAAGALVYLLAFAIGMFGAAAGAAISEAHAGWQARVFGPDGLPSLLPPVALVILATLVVVIAAGGFLDWWRRPVRRRAAGAPWWQIAGAPIDAGETRARVIGVLRGLVPGEASGDSTPLAALGSRFVDIVEENLGQPGFRELVLVATDLDARCDVVALLLREPFRQTAVSRRRAPDLRPEIVDLTGPGRDLLIDLLSAAVTPPLVCDPHLVTFAADGFWRGETHRLCDRPGSINRVLEEVAAAGVTQAIVVSAVAPAAAPHRLSPPRLDLRSRLGEMLAADSAAALRDALAMARLRFDAVYVICPEHNPIGPFDLNGVYDPASDRRQDLDELMERGYQDAGRQFIAPIVGASGERIGGPGGFSNPEASRRLEV